MVIIVMGVSGSGKTTIGVGLAARLGYEFCDADDFHPPANVEKMRGGIPLTDEDRAPWLDRLAARIENALGNGHDLVLACSALKAAYRERLRIGGAVRFVYLKGDYELIAHRLAARQDHFMQPSLLRSQFESLEEPKDALVVDVTPPPAEIVRRIIDGLDARGSSPEETHGR